MVDVYVDVAAGHSSLIVAATVLKLDSPLTSDGAGMLKLATLGTDEVVAYSCEALTVAAGGELVRVRAA